MIQLNVTATNIAVSGVETLTSGRVGLKCAFTFSEEWSGLQKIATFVGSQERSVPVDTNEVTIPWECFTDAENYRLTVAVKGTKPDGTVVLPTVYAVIGKIQRGAESAEEGAEPTPSVVAQIQSNAANALAMAQNVIGRADRGEFNGAKGDTGETGATGAKGDKGDKGDPGEDGADGYTPVRGTDYWTAADKAEIVEETAAEINYDPAAKTAAMTQSVGADADGKLWTAPYTEGNYERIGELTTEEEVYRITINMPSGVKKAIFRVDVPASDNSLRVMLAYNNVYAYLATSGDTQRQAHYAKLDATKGLMEILAGGGHNLNNPVVLYGNRPNTLFNLPRRKSARLAHTFIILRPRFLSERFLLCML